MSCVVLIKKTQGPIESTRLDDETNDNVFEEPAEVFVIRFLLLFCQQIAPKAQIKLWKYK